jgi:hypothetical protein
MTTTSSARWAVASGILAVILLFATFFVAGRAPGENDPIVSIMNFYAAHRTSQIAVAYLNLAAVMVFVVFLTGLRDALLNAVGGRQILASVAYAAGIVFVPMTVIGYSVEIILASKAATGDPMVFRAVRDIAGGAIGGSDLPLGVCVIATSAAIISTRVFPRWLGWLGLAAGLALVAGILVPVSPALGVLGFVGLLLFMIWMLATGIYALRGSCTLESQPK